MSEKISVIMSVYKESEKELKESIESILNQTYSDLEFIIVIDNPAEQWRIDYIKNIKDSRIKLIINEKNIGLPKSLNIAIKNSTGDYIARMDADDISLKNRLEEQIKFLKEMNYDMCGSNVICFLDEKDFRPIRFPEYSENVNKLLFIKNCVSHPTYLVRKNVYSDLNGYNDIFSCEDYDFLLRAVKKGFLIGNVQKVLLRYRISPNSISRKNPGKQELIAGFLRKQYKNENTQIVTEYEINKFLESKDFQKKLKDYNFYWGMKNTRSKYKEKKGVMYYFYTVCLILNIKHSLKEIYIKLRERNIKIKESNK